MTSHGTRNWNDIAAAARDLADVADGCTGEGAHRLRGPTERLRKLLETVDASRDEPTEADSPATLTVERLVSAIGAHIAKSHEPLTAGQDPAVAAHLFSEDSVELLLKARELLRALVGAAGRSPTPDPRPWSPLVEQFRSALMAEHADDWDMETVSEAAHICAHVVTSRSAAPTEREAQAIYDDVHSELSTAFGWSDSDPDDVRDWRHDLVTRVIALTQPSRSAAPTREQMETAFCASGRHSVCRGVVLPTEALCQCSCHGGDLQAVVHPLEAEIGAVVWQGIGRLVADVQDAGHDVPEVEALCSRGRRQNRPRS